jgi:hypothetical protein
MTEGNDNVAGVIGNQEPPGGMIPNQDIQPAGPTQEPGIGGAIDQAIGGGANPAMYNADIRNQMSGMNSPGWKDPQDEYSRAADQKAVADRLAMTEQAMAGGAPQGEASAQEDAAGPAPVKEEEYIDPNTGRRTKVSLRDPSLPQNRAFTNQDFYGDQRQSFQGVDVHGRPLTMPQFGEVPLGVLSARLQQEQAAQVAKAAARKKLLESFSSKKTAPQFQQDYARFVDGWMGDVLNETAEQFGGSMNEALDYYANDPKGQLAWARMGAQLEAIADETKFVVDEATDYVNDVYRGLRDPDPLVGDYAEKLVAGYTSLGTGGSVDLQELIDNGRYVKRAMSASKFVTDRIQPGISAHMRTLQQQGGAQWKGGRWTLTTETKKDYDMMIESYSKEMTEMGIFDKVSDAKTYLQGLYPVSIELKTEVRDPITSGGGGDNNENKPVRGVWGYAMAAPAMKPGQSVSPNASTGKSRETISLSGMTGKKYNIGGFLIEPTRFEKVGSEFYVVGNMVNGEAFTGVAGEGGTSRTGKSVGESGEVNESKSGASVQTGFDATKRLSWARKVTDVASDLRSAYDVPQSVPDKYIPYYVGGVYDAIENAAKENGGVRMDVSRFAGWSQEQQTQFMTEYGQAK